MNKRTLKIADEFSKYPAGRYEKDGPCSGELFRQKFLVPLLKENIKTVIVLDGTRGYGSSFLEEAFGGLVREEHFTKDEIFNTIEFKSEDETILLEIKQYIQDAS